jgi:lipoate-protein ligase A
MVRVDVHRQRLSTGAVNTALDDRLLLEAAKGKPVIAFTQWQPSISIGRSQSIDDVHLQACEQEGISVVRRRTGGQAVGLDDASIVYSLAAPRHMFECPREEIKAGVCESVASALRDFGVPAEFAPPDYVVVPGAPPRPIANSAQVLPIGSQGPVLVHGSILYHRLDERFFELMRFQGASLAPQKELAMESLSYVTQHACPSRDAIIKGLSERFSNLLGGQPAYQDSELSPVGEPLPMFSERAKRSVGSCYLSFEGLSQRFKGLSAPKPNQLGYAR